MTSQIIILAEHEEGTLREISFELLGLAHRIAATQNWDEKRISAALLGQGTHKLADELTKRGASEVLYVDNEVFANYTSDGYRSALVELLIAENPQLVLIGATPNGWDVAPLIAAQLDVPLATGCMDVSFENGRAIFTRKAFNGKFVHRVAVVNAQPLIATIDKGSSSPFDSSTSGNVRHVELAIKPNKLRSRFVEVKTASSGALDLTQANIIVSGGRGIGAPEKLGVIRELADALGAQVGASRAVTDAGWLPHEHQIGSSGVTVSPMLYIACGISGAIQHIVGMKNSNYIVAINKDPDAPIFDVADIGVVGDLFDYVPALSKAIKEAKD